MEIIIKNEELNNSIDSLIDIIFNELNKELTTNEDIILYILNHLYKIYLSDTPLNLLFNDFLEIFKYE